MCDVCVKMVRNVCSGDYDMLFIIDDYHPFILCCN